MTVAALRIGHDGFLTGSGDACDHTSPVTGGVQATIPPAGEDEVDRAEAKAGAAREGWRRTPPEARRDILLRLADLIGQMSTSSRVSPRPTAARRLMPVGGMAMTAAGYHSYYSGWYDKLDGQLFSTFDTRLYGA